MTKIPTIYQLTETGTAPRFNEAFAKGCGGTIVRDGVLRPGPLALWGEHKFYKTLHAAIAEGRTWYYGDHAYFGRGHYFRVTKNALQFHGGYFDGGPQYESNLLRLAEVQKTVPIVIEPRKSPGDFILVCPPSEALAERSGFMQDQWTRIVIKRLKISAPKRRVVVRQKPRINRTPAPLLSALQGAYALVTYSSNAAIEATLAGYPAFCTGPNPCNVFGNTDLNRIKHAHVATDAARTAWAAMLCANQWTLAEIAAGKSWEAIK